MIVIKYGGHALPQDGSADPSLELIAKEFKKSGKFVLVHGGGPQINAELELHGIKPEMINGMRKTTPQVLSVVQKVLSGDVLRGIVNQLIGLGVNAVGLSSGDGATIRAIQSKDGMGLVGEISSVDSTFLKDLIAAGYLPVISPIGVSKEGQGLNLNADLVAGEIGGSLGATKVLFMTDVAGIYRDWPDTSSLIGEIKLEDLNKISGIFTDGMVPKVKALITAVSSGAQCAYVFDGRSAENLRKAIHGEIGTMVSP